MKLFSTILFVLCFISIQAQEFKKLFSLNSEARETNLSITPNGKYLFFMSTRGGQPWSELWTEQEEGETPRYDGDIWYSIRDENGEWQPPVCLGKPVNTERGEDEPNVTVDGQAVYYQSWRQNWANTGGPYYRAELDGVVWKDPVGLDDEVNRFFKELDSRTDLEFKKDLRKKDLYDDYLILMQERNEDWDKILKERGAEAENFKIATDGMAISPDERIFVVAAFTPETNDYDLYISRKNEEDIWTYPKKLGVSTEHDEISVFIAGDNKTLYFASDRPGGSGGFDIYKTTLEQGTKCGEIINLGEPYNTDKDEYGFIVNPTKEEGFMIVDGDIVQVDLNAKAKPRDIVVINGRVVDEEDNPLQVSIDLINVSKDDKLNSIKTNAYTGEYSFSFERENGDFNQFVTTQEGITVEEPFIIMDTTSNELYFYIVIKQNKPDAQIVAALNKDKFQEGEIFRVDKLQFEANKSIIKDASFPLLDQVASILRRQTGIKVEIGGHTNTLPPKDFCDQLSTERAQKVYDYLIEKGVPEDRISYVGYGKRRPLDTSRTLQGRKLNQRVEIKILEVLN